MWSKYDGYLPDNFNYQCTKLALLGRQAIVSCNGRRNDLAFDDRKKYLKKRAFEIVADQTGKLFDPNVFTIVWARRFAGYKRADLITTDMERFKLYEQ